MFRLSLGRIPSVKVSSWRELWMLRIPVIFGGQTLEERENPSSAFVQIKCLVLLKCSADACIYNIHAEHSEMRSVGSGL